MTLTQYAESTAAQYDPIRPKVIGGLTESILRADLKELHVMKDNEGYGLNGDITPFVPDVVMGHHGKKVGLYVLNDDRIMRDTKRPCGFTDGKMRLVEQAHKLTGEKSAIKNIALAVSEVVSVDLKNYQLSLKNGFNI